MTISGDLLRIGDRVQLRHGGEGVVLEATPDRRFLVRATTRLGWFTRSELTRAARS